MSLLKEVEAREIFSKAKMKGSSRLCIQIFCKLVIFANYFMVVTNIRQPHENLSFITT
jgi:hypothetical protein